MQWKDWLPFWEKYQDRILYGTDYYAFPKNESWEVAFQRRPKLLREFLETEEEHEYLGESFIGVNLDKKLRDKIYRKNFEKLLNIPQEIDCQYLINEAKRLLQLENKKSTYVNEDLEYLLKNIQK